MKYINSITTIIVSGIMIGLFALANNNAIFAQTASTSGSNVTSFVGPFIIFTQVWGGDFPITQTFVYDSYSNKSVGVFGSDVSVNKPSAVEIAELKGDIQQSGIQSIKSDEGVCDITQICYLLHTVAPMGFTGQVETHSITWNSDSNQTEYANLNGIMSKIQKFGY